MRCQANLSCDFRYKIELVAVDVLLHFQHRDRPIALCRVGVLSNKCFE